MLQVQPSGSNAEQLVDHGSKVLTAYDFYVQGIGYLQRYERLENVESAIILFQRERDRGGRCRLNFRISAQVSHRLCHVKLAIILPDNPVALAGGVFKFLAVDDLHCATGILDELFLLQDTSCYADARSTCP
jgi:hypothetical protein